MCEKDFLTSSKYLNYQTQILNTHKTISRAINFSVRVALQYFMPRLRILHLSDLHERIALPSHSKDRQTQVKIGAAQRYRVLGDDSGFWETLAQIKSESAVHAVCFTGDIADWGLLEEFRKATPRIKRILQTVDVPENRFFAVPGNHDINRNLNQAAWQGIRDFAAQEPSAQEQLSTWFAGGKPPRGLEPTWREQLMARSADFWTWLAQDFRRDSLLPANNPHSRFGFRETLGEFDFPVHIVGFDSAWLCGDNNDQGKLLLTDAQLNTLAFDGEAPLEGFRLALIHHPLTDLADANRQQQRLAGSVDLVLRGHQHEPSAFEYLTPDRKLRVFAAGSLFEGDLGDRYVNGFQVVDIDFTEDGQPKAYSIEFWAYSTNGFWHKNSAIYKNAKYGKHTWKVTSRPKKVESDLSEAEIRIQNALSSKSASLDLSDLNLKVLPKSIENLIHLNKLDISQNSLTSIGNSLNKLTNLEILMLYGNSLVNFPESISKLKNLKKLDIWLNSIISIPESIGNLKNLTTLDISHNSLTSIPESIIHLKKLKTLDISYNFLKSIPESIANLVLIENLKLQGNSLTILPEIFSKLTQIRTLDVSNNSLKRLPKSISKLTELTTLTTLGNVFTSSPT
jgi:predicted phosphodiesterase